jgi:hypothetical protein
MSTLDDLKARCAEPTAAQLLRRLVAAGRAVLGRKPSSDVPAVDEDDEAARRREAATKVRQAIDAGRRRVGR